MFYVETKLVKKSRGFKTVNANVYLMDRQTGQYNLLATENIAIPNHKDMIALDYDFIQAKCDQTSLSNGDRIIGNTANAPYCFSELITNEIVYNSYISSTNKLLGLDRSI